MLRIALVQIDLQNNKAKAIEHTLKLLKKIGLSDSDIVCLPELWYSKIVTNFETEFGKIIDAGKRIQYGHNSGGFCRKKQEQQQ